MSSSLVQIITTYTKATLASTIPRTSTDYSAVRIVNCSRTAMLHTNDPFRAISIKTPRNMAHYSVHVQPAIEPALCREILDGDGAALEYNRVHYDALVGQSGQGIRTAESLENLVALSDVAVKLRVVAACGRVCLALAGKGEYDLLGHWWDVDDICGIDFQQLFRNFKEMGGCCGPTDAVVLAGARSGYMLDRRVSFHWLMMIVPRYALRTSWHICNDSVMLAGWLFVSRRGFVLKRSRFSRLEVEIL